MRRLIWGVIMLAALWSGWWWLASLAVERGVQGWLSDRQAEGWQADVGTIAVSGYPMRFALDFQDIAVADPTSASAVRASELEVSAPSYWPGDLTLRVPDTPVTLTVARAQVIVQTTDAEATLNLHPGTALALETAVLESEAWQIRDLQGSLLGGESLHTTIQQAADDAARYHFTFDADELAPGTLIRDALAIPQDWDETFDALSLSAMAGFDSPLDRFTLERAPQPRHVTVEHLRINWGLLNLSAQGTVEIAEDGTPDGQIDLLVENWRATMDQAQTSGLLSPTQRGQAEFFLGALANRGDDPNNLDLSLRFENGLMFLGPIALGPAPSLLVR